jgi:flavin reductase
MTESFSPDRTRFREAMARLGAAVNIITSRGPEGDSGFTASAVCSVTDDPPTLLVCMNRGGSQYETFKAAGFFCVNILTPDQEELSPVFAGKMTMPERFARSEWIRLATGAPVLETAAAGLDCKVTQIVDVGTHSVMFGTVQAIHLGLSSSGLIYHGRAYHKIVG